MNSKSDWDEIKRNAQLGNLEAIPSNVFVTHYNKLKQIANDYKEL